MNEIDENTLMNIIDKECEKIKNFINYWLNNKEIPALIIRIEDIYANCISTFKDIFSFLLNCENIKETVVESKILTFAKFNKNLKKFIDEGFFNFFFRIYFKIIVNFF